MNGAHDMGGMQCFGAMLIEEDEPLFHHEWERRAFALVMAMGATGAWNLDQSRFGRESLPADFYLGAGYYRIWLAGLQSLMLQLDLISDEEIESGKSIQPAKVLPRRAEPARIPAALSTGAPVTREAQVPAQFALGQQLRVRRDAPTGHTRVPRYVRGCVGEVVRMHGCHVFPDSHARGEGENPQWLYNLRFDAAELWGADAQRSSVHVDLWEPYLEPRVRSRIKKVCTSS